MMQAPTDSLPAKVGWILLPWRAGRSFGSHKRILDPVNSWFTLVRDWSPACRYPITVDLGLGWHRPILPSTKSSTVRFAAARPRRTATKWQRPDCQPTVHYQMLLPWWCVALHGLHQKPMCFRYAQQCVMHTLAIRTKYAL